MATVTGVAARDGMDAIFAHQIRYLAAPEDIALGISADGHCPSVRAGLAEARARGLLTIALAGGDGGAAQRLRRTWTTCWWPRARIRAWSRNCR